MYAYSFKSGKNMARGRSSGYDDQREAILQQATELFAERGYTETSMNQVAEACGLSKPALYHYFRDKSALLVGITEEHVMRLESVTEQVMARNLAPQACLEALIISFVQEYAGARHAHRVLVDEIRFLQESDRIRILDRERHIVSVFAGVICKIRPELQEAGLAKPLTMLLFGMINWMFTWLRSDGKLTYEDMAPMVADFFFGGLAMVKTREEHAV
jgi:AcrR family transcriptional regulator